MMKKTDIQVVEAYEIQSPPTTLRDKKCRKKNTRRAIVAEEKPRINDDGLTP